MAVLLGPPLLLTLLAPLHNSLLRPPWRPAAQRSPLARQPPPPLLPLPRDAVVELWHDGRLRLANFRGLAESSTALRVELSDGAPLKIDAGQLIDCWERGPNSTAAWTALHAEAARLLAELPPHMLDLRPLWLQLTTRKGGGWRVTSDAVGAALFGAHASGARAPLARRLAAAQLLGDEQTLFKRVLGEGEGGGGGSVLVRLGGFRALPRAQANSRAEMALLEAMRRRLAGEEVRWTPAMLPLLADIEMVALGLSASCPKPVLRLLSALGQPADQEGARELLLRTGQWGSAEGEASGGDALSSAAISPFSAQVLAEAHRVAREALERRGRYAEAAAPSAQSRRASVRKAREHELWTPFRLPELRTPPGGCDGAVDLLDGRVDLRSRCERVYAIDADSTEFRDDAVSYDLESGTLMVHIADVASCVDAGSPLDEVARLRLQSIYASAMPLHMMPPVLLKSVCLSETLANECLTALLQLDATGRVRYCRLVRSVIPPVRALTFAQVDELIVDRSIDSIVHKELRALATLTLQRAHGRGRGLNRTESTVRWRSVRDGAVKPELILRTPARAMVDELLGMYSYAARGTTRRLNMLRLPQSEHQRIGTGPLRRYSDLVAQRQLCAALCGEAGMPASEVAAVERWIKQKQADLNAALQRTEQPQMLRALQSVCSRQASATGTGFAVLEGTVVKPATPPKAGGRGGALELRLEAGGMLAYLTTHTAAQARRAEQCKAGSKLRVRLRSVDMKSGRVDVEML
ncbi:hypothetical protein AB1Y20_012450 [Prymnesium parvum]|uniref:RNB domain-containing protein n=1 Tax=Prymnesium parvum TaxID=97485 RepID=A0AB34IIW8_PRYPA